ncbi:MAG: PIN domain-containing protein [Atopobiaceae bacterium]|nr:PIN domain-containing protein [Atopobiaceae bacterium]
MLAHALTGTLVPVMGAGIEDEYAEVLSRKKFGFDAGLVARVLSALESSAAFRPPSGTPKELSRVPDPKDVEFYAVTLSAREERDASLVTGYAKHFLQEPFAVSPRQMLDVLESRE